MKILKVLTLFAVAALAAEPAFAHHLMGGKTPSTVIEGLLTGLGHPVIGIDHFAAVVAVGCLAAAHRAGPALAIGFIVVMMGGVALHLHGATVPAAELLVALTVIALGGILLRWPRLPVAAASGLFALVGLIHGYALGESIYGAEPAPLYAYLAGLAIIQSVIALGAMTLARTVVQAGNAMKLRFVGAGVAGVGLAVLMQQVVPAPPV
jgi:urease accessory protein